MATPFAEASYQSQVNRLRAVAVAALKLFPIRPDRVEFIHHGENTTFKVTAGRRAYLMRIHRAIYHSTPALLEEMKWLEHLSTTSIIAPRPVLSREGQLIVSVDAPAADGPRNCDLLKWVDGRFVWKNARPVHLEKVGRTLALLQNDARGRQVRHRRYWTAEGLLGREAKLGSFWGMDSLPRRERSLIESAARDLIRIFEKYESKDRCGLIHADLHFGNMLFRDDGVLAPIDFDDCGYGFYAYDLCVPVVNIEGLRELKPSVDINDYRSALFAGYRSVRPLDARDEEMVRLFGVARRITMMGWMNARLDNPRFRPRMRGVIDRALLAIKTL